MADELDNDVDTGPSEELVKEAREMGWRPLEEFKGNKEKWVPAEEYVDRGKHVLPIVQADRDRLKKELLTLKQQNGTLQSQIEELRSAQERLDAQFSEVNKRDVATAKAALKERLKKAREEDDVDAEMEIQDTLALLNKEPEKKPTQQDKKQTTPSINPELLAWNDDNPWFGDDSKLENMVKSEAVLAIGKYLRKQGNQLDGREFMDECVRVYEEQNPGKKPEGKGPGKYESGSNRQAGSQGGNGKSYSSLPAEAKEACMEYVDQLVGPNKSYKTVEDWQKAYAIQYHKDNQ